MQTHKQTKWKRNHRQPWQR